MRKTFKKMTVGEAPAVIERLPKDETLGSSLATSEDEDTITFDKDTLRQGLEDFARLFNVPVEPIGTLMQRIRGAFAGLERTIRRLEADIEECRRQIRTKAEPPPVAQDAWWTPAKPYSQTAPKSFRPERKTAADHEREAQRYLLTQKQEAQRMKRTAGRS